MDSARAGIWMAYVVVIVGSIVFCIYGMIKLFRKMDKPGWAAVVPFYGLYCMLDACGMNGWLCLLQIIPVVGYIFTGYVSAVVADRFGKPAWFVILSALLGGIVLCFLGYTDDEFLFVSDITDDNTPYDDPQEPINTAAPIPHR